MFGRDFIYVLGGVIPLAVSGLMLPALTRLMGREQFGIVSLAVAISWVLYMTLTFGMEMGVQREYPRAGGELRARGMIAVSAIAIVILTAGLAASAHRWSGLLGAGRFPWAMELASIWSGAAAITMICLGFLRSADKLWAFLVVVLTQSVGAQFIGVALLLARAHSAREYILGLLIGQLVAAVVALIFVRPRLLRAVTFESLRRALSFSLPLVPNLLAGFLLWSGDRLVVQRDLGSIAQARYAVAYAVGAMAINVTSQLNQAWMPRVFTIHDVAARRRVLAQVQQRLIRLLAPTVIGISLAVPFLLVVASPRSYDPRSLVLVTLLIVPTALPYSVALANTRALLAHGKSGRLATLTFACAALNIGLNILWVPHIGITGSALATLVAYACQAWLSGMVVSSEDRLPNRLGAEVLEWTIVAACLATALIPSDAIGIAGRAAAVLAAMVTLAITLRRSRQPSGVPVLEPIPVTGARAAED